MQDKKINKESFFEWYPQLKRNEDWHQILRLGKYVLKSDRTIKHEEKARIATILATTFHYLGIYFQSAQYCWMAINNAVNAEQRVHAYYLFSAVKRSQAQQKDATEQCKKDSMNWIEKALEMVENQNLKISDFRKAKVFFNAGAFYQDLLGAMPISNPMAQNYYEKAMSLFSHGSDNYNRTAIRNLRLILESGKAKTALQGTKILYKIVEKGTKTFVHLLQLEANITSALGKKEEALLLLDQALSMSRAKNMRGDITRLTSIKEQIIRSREICHGVTALNLSGNIELSDEFISRAMYFGINSESLQAPKNRI